MTIRHRLAVATLAAVIGTMGASFVVSTPVSAGGDHPECTDEVTENKYVKYVSTTPSGPWELYTQPGGYPPVWSTQSGDLLEGSITLENGSTIPAQGTVGDLYYRYQKTGETRVVEVPVDCPPVEKKVFVCKYVGTPGVDERLQTGDNPISVSVNSIPDPEGDGVHIGDEFSDQHGRSIVIAFDEGQPEPDLSQCPPPDGPTPPTEWPAPTVEVICGAEDVIHVPDNTEEVTFVVKGGPGHTIVKAIWTYDGSVLQKWEFTDNNEECPPTEVTPPAPTPVDECGTERDGVIIPEFSEAYSFHKLVDGWDGGLLDPGFNAWTGKIIVSPNEGFIFPGGTESIWEFTFTDEPCDQPPTEWPEPTQEVICGAEDVIHVPDNTEEVTFVVSKGEPGHTTVQALWNFDDSVLETWTFTDDGKECPTTPPNTVPVPARPSVNDPCGANNATWIVPANTATVTWTLTNGHLVATTTTGNNFGNGVTTHDYGTAPDSGVACALPSTGSSTGVFTILGLLMLAGGAILCFKARRNPWFFA